MLAFSVGGRDGIIGILLTDGHVHFTHRWVLAAIARAFAKIARAAPEL